MDYKAILEEQIKLLQDKQKGDGDVYICATLILDLIKVAKEL